MIPPVSPWIVNQPWGVPNEIYRQFGFGQHNGIDVAVDADGVIQSPVDGVVLRAADKENGQWQPNGGGIFISVLSNEEYDFDDGVKSHVLFDFLHCERLLKPEGADVLSGDYLAIQDNTGFSTGPHTHIQARRCNVLPGGDYYFKGSFVHLEWVDKNDANNSFDFTPYLNFENTNEDIKKKLDIATKIVALLSKLVPLWIKLKGRNK